MKHDAITKEDISNITVGDFVFHLYILYFFFIHRFTNQIWSHFMNLLISDKYCSTSREHILQHIVFSCLYILKWDEDDVSIYLA